ncbi:MAG: LPXTG cell wall anchor domain-containing protein [Clostridia bacterium]|nr:LPXTG cell wall anchor domain-containing protein [Clostridia bacterium]
MKKLVALVLSVAIVLSLAMVSTVSAAGTFCADSFAVTRADGSVVNEFGAVADMGQLKGFVDNGAVNIHAAGWYLPTSAMEDIGYQHDDGEITWGTAFVDSAIYGPLNSELPLRYRFDTPILEGTHTFRILARLTNGEVVTAFETHYINDNTVIAEWVNINTGGDGAGIGLWLKTPGQYAAAAFTATDAFDGLRIPINWSSRPDKDQPETYEMLVYRFVNNIENSLSKTPLVRQEYAPEGDHGGGDMLEFEALPKGQYVFVIRLLTAENGGYFVLPVNGNTTKAIYATDVGDGTQTFNFGIRSFSKDTIFGDLPEITDTPDPATVVNSSFDSFYVNDTLNFGEGDGNASGKLDNHDRTVDGSDGSISRLVIRGWIGFADEIESFGYKIGDAEPVLGEFKTATEAGVLAAGGAFASRFEIVIDPSNIVNEKTIVAVVKLLNSDDIVIMDENYGGANTSFTYIGASGEEPPVTQPTTQPATQPQTGDAAVAMIAVLAVLAMGAAVVFAKKRSF